jgi:hypothetical protein
VNPRDFHAVIVNFRIGLDSDKLSIQKFDIRGDVFLGPAYKRAGEAVFEAAVIDLDGILD